MTSSSMADETMLEVASILVELPSLISADESRKRGLLIDQATAFVFPKTHKRKRLPPQSRKDCESSRVRIEARVQSRVSTEPAMGDFLAGRTSTYLRVKKPVETKEEVEIPELPSDGADPSWPRLPGLELDVEKSAHAILKLLEQKAMKLSKEEQDEALSLIARKKVVIVKGLDEALRFYRQLMEHSAKLELKGKEALARAQHCCQQLKKCSLRLDREEAEIKKQCLEGEGGDLIPPAA